MRYQGAKRVHAVSAAYLVNYVLLHWIGEPADIRLFVIAEKNECARAAPAALVVLRLSNWPGDLLKWQTTAKVKRRAGGRCWRNAMRLSVHN
jgi:hypothetical protein